MLKPLVIYGTLIHSLAVSDLRYVPNGLVCISHEGIIVWVEENVREEALAETLKSKAINLEAVEFIKLSSSQFVIPGLVDTHTHAPQYPNIGSGGQYELLDWLQNCTFPKEAQFQNVEYARKVYNKVVKSTLNSGTTTACYYGTLHLEATKALADIIQAGGQRAFVGKCNMDRNCPDFYIEPSTEISLADTKTLVDYIHSLSPSNPLVHPILTPRFAISCTDDCLKEISTLQNSFSPPLALQTHMSENLSECEFVKELFPGSNHYADVYDQFGLLNDRTILAHCVHLSGEEMNLIKERKAGVSHCPTSNLFLRSGVARVGEMLDRGIKVGLGTDCSGGSKTGILSQIREASTASKVLMMLDSAASIAPPTTGFASKHIPLSALFYCATIGGASLCNLEEKIGNFLPGKEWDAILVDVECGGTWVEEDDEIEKKFEKFLMNGDERDLRKVWVRGQLVGGADK